MPGTAPGGGGAAAGGGGGSGGSTASSGGGGQLTWPPAGGPGAKKTGKVLNVFGYDCVVKDTGNGLWGPGPNLWRGGEDFIW